MSADDPVARRYNGLDLFVGAGPSTERCAAAIDDVLGVGYAQFVQGEDLDALVAAVERATIGWVVCHRSNHPGYPYRFDVNMLDGSSTIKVVPEIVRRLGVAIVVPDDGTADPYAGLRFGPDGTARPFSLLAFDY